MLILLCPIELKGIGLFWYLRKSYIPFRSQYNLSAKAKLAMSEESEKELAKYLREMLESFQADSEKVKLVQKEFANWCKENGKKPSEQAFEEYLKQQFYRMHNHSSETMR